MNVGEFLDELPTIVNHANLTLNGINNVEIEGYYKRIRNFPKLVDVYDENKRIDIIGLQDDYLDSRVLVKGRLRFDYNSYGIYPKIIVSEFKVIEEETHVDETLEYFYTLKNNHTPQVLSVELKNLLNKNGKVKCAVIHGTKAQTHIDFINGVKTNCKNYEKYLDINTYEVSLQNDEELANTINRVDADIIFLVRGGGDKESLTLVGGINSAISILEKEKPFYIALGHSQDRDLSVLEQVCDERYQTPSILGNVVGNVLEEYHQSKLIEKERNELLQKLTEMSLDLQKVKTELDTKSQGIIISKEEWNRINEMLLERDKLAKEKLSLENALVISKNENARITQIAKELEDKLLNLENKLSKRFDYKVVVGIVIVFILIILILLLFHH